MNRFPVSSALAGAVIILALSGCGTAQSVGRAAGTVGRSMAGAGRATLKATTATTRFLGSGARKAAGQAARLWPWRGEAQAESAAGTSPAAGPAATTPSPAAGQAATGASSTTAPDAPIAGFKFPSGNLLVARSEFGPGASHLENAGVTLPGGWDIKAASIWYHTDTDGLSARVLRADGSPATASSTNGDVAEAAEIHFRNATGVLVLRGNPVLRAGANSVRGSSPATVIRIHVPTGAISVDGPARWGD